jgi:hypothetical protein
MLTHVVFSTLRESSCETAEDLAGVAEHPARRKVVEHILRVAERSAVVADES